ncbi:MAG TPA: hypothetical protein VIG33_12875 [Pseudobdellovibrionaceae bacterium]
MAKNPHRQWRLKIHGGIMSEAEMVFYFCVVYSGILSGVIWVNILANQRVRGSFGKVKVK